MEDHIKDFYAMPGDLGPKSYAWKWKLGHARLRNDQLKQSDEFVEKNSLEYKKVSILFKFIN